MCAAGKPEEKDVIVDGLRLHYLDWGGEGQPYMLLLHGGGQTAHTWDDVAPALGGLHHVVALDQRGHGDSSWAPNGEYSVEAHLGDINGFAQALGMRSFVLIGLSMGGMNAIAFTATHPRKVRALGIVDVGPDVNPEGVREIREFTSVDIRSSFEDFLEAAKKFNKRRTEANLRHRLSHSLKQLPDGRWTWKQDPAIRDFHARPQRPRRDLWADVAKIRCPTTVIRGGESKVLTVEATRKLVAAIPGCRLATIPGAGHSVMGDNPRAFEKAVQQFLASIPQRTTTRRG
ncbi:MAG: alpha/beta hydrolase [Chloroflexi bacterium]|nr:alpha/beta hydrolase [Chloroflexota bacterium]